ncbi:MAG: ribonuclease J [Actinobacteria bacterium]|nr:MAG: ribonuclease J [Actinomycetota bacterium]
MTAFPTDPRSARLVFLGGVGEVGRNMAALELDGRLLVIDAGLSFPEVEMPGIDLVLPDFQFLRDNSDRVEAVVLTHGHEDHVGSLPYLLREFALPVYGTKLTLALIEGKLEEHGVRDRAQFHEIVPGQELRSGPFTMRFHRVAHSIPDGVALAVDLPAGTLLHSGDFKLDTTPIDGRVTDLQGIAQEASRGVHVFLSDSTNAEDPGMTGSERTVGPVLRDIVRDARRLVVVACFASHIHRIQQVANAAAAAGRKIAFLGRSMHQSVSAARALGYLDVPETEIVAIEEVETMDPSRLVVCCTGSQGEPLSALSLMAAHEHKYIHLVPGDAVVLSSSVIPGNETAIHRTVDGLYRTGADVFHVPAAPVHVSGHAAGEELKFMLNLVRPRWFIPIHGELRHLAHHARLARDVGIPPERVLLVEDGDTVELGDIVRKGERVTAGMTFVDGLGIGDVGEVVLRDRRKLAGDGIVVVVVTVDAHSGEVLAGPDVINRGFVFDEAAEPILEEARHRTLLSIKEASVQGVSDPTVLREHIRRALRRYFVEVTQRKPIIVPVIMEV